MTEAFIGEIKMVSFDYAPRGWALCNGQLVSINQNQALFALLGTQYGGDGRVNFALPNLQSRVPLHVGNGITQGQAGGNEAVVLTAAQMPVHTHQLSANTSSAADVNLTTPAAGNALGQSVGDPSSGPNFPVNLYSDTLSQPGALAPATIGNFGGNQAHENRQPFLTINFIIALIGIFPSRN